MDQRIVDALRSVTTPSLGDVRRGSDVLLRHPPAYLKGWAAWRAAVGDEDSRSPRSRALWYVLDSVLKQAPLLYVPLCSTPEFEAFCIKHLPWDSSDAADVEWPIALVRSWEGLVGRGVWGALQQHGATLHARLIMRGAKLGFDASDETAVASKKDLEDLHDATNALVSLMASLQQRHLRVAAERQATVVVAEAQASPPVEDSAAQPNAQPNVDNDDDDEYEPVFVEGGEVRAKPAEAAIKREPRKRARPRADDEE
jgi:hypothetical protein